ncbi:MAG: DUF1571 domain-containing protein [Planctomycetaceae bacterium]
MRVPRTLGTLAAVTLMTAAVAAQDAADLQSDVAEQHPLAPALRLARASEQAAGGLTDYVAVFSKREFVNGRRDLHQMQIKFRESPFSVYMKFLSPHAGREVLYVEGANGGNLLAHGTGIKGLIGTVALDPDGPRAMSEGRYPITLFGMKKMVHGVIRQWERDTEHPAAESQVVYYQSAQLGNTECLAIEVKHPVRQPHYPYHLTRLYIDKATRLPVRLEQYAFPSRPGGEPILVEEYTYSQIHSNVGLTDADFSTRNPAYDF